MRLFVLLANLLLVGAAVQQQCTFPPSKLEDEPSAPPLNLSETCSPSSMAASRTIAVETSEHTSENLFVDTRSQVRKQLLPQPNPSDTRYEHLKILWVNGI